MIMLGQAIGRADNRVTVLWRGVFILRRLEALDHGIVRLLRMEWIVNRTLNRFVVFGEGSIRKSGERRKDSPYTFRVHNERAHVIFGFGIGLEVGYVVSNPLL